MMVYPAPGRRVRDPHTKALLPETGREVPDHDFYWLRRLRDGDVTTEAPAATDDRMAAARSANDTAGPL